MASQYYRKPSQSSAADKHAANAPAPAPRAAPRRSAAPRIGLRPRLHELADGQLVTLALNGEAKAFPELMLRYGDRVRGIINKRVCVPEEAAELVQDTLLSAWSALQTYPANRPFELWLVCIALNKCRDWGRRRMVRRRAAVFMGDWGRNDVETADEILIQLDGIEQLQAAIERLPDSLRAPLALTALQDLSHKHTALVLGISIKSVETRVHRAKQRLKDQLDKSAR